MERKIYKAAVAIRCQAGEAIEKNLRTIGTLERVVLSAPTDRPGF
jgi:hypothetical protein